MIGFIETVCVLMFCFRLLDSWFYSGSTEHSFVYNWSLEYPFICLSSFLWWISERNNGSHCIKCSGVIIQLLTPKVKLSTYTLANSKGHTTQLHPHNPQIWGFDSSHFFSKSSKRILTKWSWVPVFNPPSLLVYLIYFILYLICTSSTLKMD